MELYAKIASLEKDDMKALEGAFDGIVVGDPFCPKRASRAGKYSIISMALEARGRGLKVTLQTPVYMTGDLFDDTLSLARCLAEERCLHRINVSDLAFLAAAREFPARLVWDSFGSPRDYSWNEVPVSAELLRFLADHGAQAFELSSSLFSLAQQEKSFPPVAIQLLVSRWELVTFGRFCHHERLIGRACTAAPLCEGRPLTLAECGRSDGRYRVRGFTLCHERTRAEALRPLERLGEKPPCSSAAKRALPPACVEAVIVEEDTVRRLLSCGAAVRRLTREAGAS